MRMSTQAKSLAPHFADFEQQHEAATLGMWIFLATEVMFFGGLFTGYAVYRLRYPHAFAVASAQLNLVYASVNTVVLLTSSLTMALAVYFAKIGRRRWLAAFLSITALLGTAFLVIKSFEYHSDYMDNLVPGLAFVADDWQEPGGVRLFLLLYYFMTGVHALHLIVGIVLMLVLAVLAWRGHFKPWHVAPVEVGGLYWHFVDVIWIFLLPLLYMVGVR
jgi:cytochrome c oxidase subunit III